MTTSILLVAACLAFLILEVLVVSFGTLSLVAITCGIWGILQAFQVGPVFGWSMLGIVVVGGPACLVGAFKILPKLPFAKGLHLEPPVRPAAATAATAATAADGLLGAIGTAISQLRPAGTAEFDGSPRDVVTRGTMVESGTRVKVVEVRGNRIVVEQVE